MTNNTPADDTDEVMKELERELKRVEIRKTLAEAEEAEHQAALTRSARLEEERIRLYADAKKAERVYWFTYSVTSTSVTDCIDRLAAWHRTDIVDGREPTPFDIRFTSPGGSVLDGFALFDELRRYSNMGHHITTTVQGVAASMAGVLLQAGDHRVIGRDSRLHLHEPSAGQIGKMTEIGDTHELLKGMFNQMLDIYAERSTLTKAEIKAKVERHEWWLTGAEAVEAGFADEVA